MPNTKKSTKGKKTAKKTAKKATSKKTRSTKGQFAPVESRVENTQDQNAPKDAESEVQTTYFRDPVSGDAPRTMDTNSTVSDIALSTVPDTDLIGDIRPEVEPPAPTPEEGAQSDVVAAEESHEDASFGEGNPCGNKNCDICYLASIAAPTPEQPGPIRAMLNLLWSYVVSAWNYTPLPGTILGAVYVTRVAVVVLALLAGIFAASVAF